MAAPSNQMAKIPNRCGAATSPFQVVTDHPGISCIDPKLAEGMEVGPLIGLSELVLALDLNVVETTCQVETFDLGSLRFGCSIGHQGEARAA